MMSSHEKIFLGIASVIVSLTFIFPGGSSQPNDLHSIIEKGTDRRIYKNGYKLDSLSVGEYQANYPKTTEHIYNDFDLQSKVCGYNKCFFLSKAFSDYGYLMSPRGLFPNSQKSYELGHRLEEEDYMIVQPFLTPPELVPLSQEMAEQIGVRGYENQLFTPGEIVVTKVRTIKDAVVLGCNMVNGKTSDEFKKVLPQWMKQSENPTTFSVNFHDSIHATKLAMLENPCLFLDMHVMVDKFGYVHQIDLDRCYHDEADKVPENQREFCIDSLNYMIKRVQHLKTAENLERKNAM